MPGTISQYQVVIAGQLITASLWNGMELNIINNGLIPAGIDDYSANDTEMQTMTDPYPASATSRPTSLQGEMERLRYQLDQLIGKTYWYEDPDVDIATFKTRFDAHTHSGAANQGPQITSSGIAAAAVDETKIAASVAGGGLSGGAGSPLVVNTDNSTMETSSDILRVKASGITANEIATSVAGNGLAGGAGTALSVNVDASTIEINSDTVRVKDGGITYAKLASDVTDKLSPKTIQKFATSSGAINLGTSTNAVVTATVNQTITAVTTAKSLVIVQGCRYTAASAGSFTDFQVKAQLTSTTNVELIFTTVTNGNNANNTVTITCDFTVVEWN